MTYVPPPGDDWEHMTPAAAGMDAGRLAEAVKFAEDHETAWSRDLAEQIAKGAFEPAPWNEILGPTKPRGGPNGLILRDGCIVAEWGDTDRSDLTFSVTKSYLAILAGIAVADGLIRNVDDPVRDYALDDGFDSDHNRAITWRHLLEQTSEWEGTLWDKPDQVDRHRQVGPGKSNARKGTHRDLKAPGAHWEYNDVRVNRLSLSLMQVFRRPLPEVLKERVMDPIGASDAWDWHGYRNSWVESDGRRMQSVSGGAHWGGGMWIGSRDHARMGLLIADSGRWGDRQILDPAWIAEMLTPAATNPIYGYLWWLNTGQANWPDVPADSVSAVGAGNNIVWLHAPSRLVVVARWIQDAAVAGLLARVMAALD